MFPQQLVDGLAYVSKEFYSFPSVFKRFFGIKPGHRSLVGVRLYLTINWFFGRRYRSIYAAAADNVAQMPEEVRQYLPDWRTG
jgi:hypothetical protein